MKATDYGGKRLDRCQIFDAFHSSCGGFLQRFTQARSPNGAELQ